MKEIKTLVNSLHEAIPEKEITYYDLDRNGLRYRAYEASLELFLIEQKLNAYCYDGRNEDIDSYYNCEEWEELQNYIDDLRKIIADKKHTYSLVLESMGAK